MSDIDRLSQYVVEAKRNEASASALQRELDVFLNLVVREAQKPLSKESLFWHTVFTTALVGCGYLWSLAEQDSIFGRMSIDRSLPLICFLTEIHFSTARELMLGYLSDDDGLKAYFKRRAIDNLQDPKNEEIYKNMWNQLVDQFPSLEIPRIN